MGKNEPAPGRVHLHSQEDAGDGWTRAQDIPPPTDEPPHGAPRPDPDPNYSAFDSNRVDPSAEKIWHDQGAPYGRMPDGTPYPEKEYAKRFLRVKPGGIPDKAWPPNEGAVAGTKLDYTDAHKFVRDFGCRVDRLGVPEGVFFGLAEGGPSSFEARALPYDSLYKKLHAYTLIPEKLPKNWKIRVMETAPAFGQPGGSLAVKFFDDIGNEISARDLTDKIGVLRDER